MTSPGGPASTLFEIEGFGYSFVDPRLLELALSHRSWCAERGGSESNERLEYLGDAVLGLIVADFSFHSFPGMSDGELSKLRASVVNATVLADVARTTGLGEKILLGKGEDLSGGRDKDSILSDVTEAVIGAIYCDGGWSAARSVVLHLLGDRITDARVEPGVSDHKSRLQEVAVQLGHGVPTYEVEGFGPDHARRYVAKVHVAGRCLGSGEGRSKKDAEQAAARAACMTLDTERGGGNA